MKYIPLLFLLYRFKKLRFNGNETTCPKIQPRIHLAPKPTHSPWGNNCILSVSTVTQWRILRDGKQTILCSYAPWGLFFSPALTSPSALFFHFGLVSTLPFLSFFPKANTPCETWSTGFQAGTTAAVEQARPCQMTRWRPSAAPCTKWSPRTWRTLRLYGTRAAWRSWSASLRAKEISKSGGDAPSP